MTARLAHRGPDFQGAFIDGPLAFGHRRLSVLDTRDVANQPMTDDSGRFVIVHNGEIYNFREIRKDLEARGIRFRTNSDTEVILEAYKIFGEDCLRHFNGMFAFAIWNADEQKLFIARDRLGKKPLYFKSLDHGGVVFASEIKALREDPNVCDVLNIRALNQYLSLNYILTNEAIFEGVEKLPPGYFLTIGRDKPLRLVRYWDIASFFLEKRAFKNEAEAGEELRDLIDDAVRLRLVSDVPLGAFLSGGLDSSTIVAAMSLLNDANSVRSFSIGFSEEGFDERRHANLVARALGVNHVDQEVTEDMASALPDISYFADEPFADTSIIPMYFLSRMTREHVTVSLSGDGADEIFAGYETYAADYLRHLTRWVPAGLVRTLELIARTLLPELRGKVSFDYKLRQFLKGHQQDAVGAHYAWRLIFTEDDKSDLLRPDVRDAMQTHDPLSEFRRFADEVAPAGLIDKMMYVDLKTWLVDDILVKTDRASMAHGLETRMPFLDHRLVEFAAALPIDLKMKGLKKKYLLKRSQTSRLPASTLSRRKAGFNAPLAHWMDRESGGLFQGLDVKSLSGEFFQETAVRRLCEDHWSGRRDNHLKLFSLIALHHWQNEMRRR